MYIINTFIREKEEANFNFWKWKATSNKKKGEISLFNIDYVARKLQNILCNVMLRCFIKEKRFFK